MQPKKITMTYEPSCGTHINSACAEASRMAQASGLPVCFKFNDVELVAIPNRTANDLVSDYDCETKRRAEEYRNSPEGIAQAARRKAEIEKLAQQSSKLLRKIDSVLAANSLDSVMGWLKEFIPTADDVSVRFDTKALGAKFEVAGFKMNEGVGQKPEWFHTRERMGRYIVGQVINFLKDGMPPHPITTSFIEKYEALPS